MKRFISKAADATSAEGPKLTIDLAKLSNPFASKVVDPLALPFKRWRVRLRAWTDARRGLGSASDVQLTGYETEILAHQDRKLLELEKATQEHRLTVRQALKSVEAQSFDAGD